MRFQARSSRCSFLSMARALANRRPFLVVSIAVTNGNHQLFPFCSLTEENALRRMHTSSFSRSEPDMTYVVVGELLKDWRPRAVCVVFVQAIQLGKWTQNAVGATP